MGLVNYFVSLVGWLPVPLNVIAVGVICLFFLFTVLHLVAFILDIIPFL